MFLQIKKIALVYEVTNIEMFLKQPKESIF